MGRGNMALKDAGERAGRGSAQKSAGNSEKNGRLLRGLAGVFFHDGGDGGLVELKHHAFRDFDRDGAFLHVVHQPVNAGGGDDRKLAASAGQN